MVPSNLTAIDFVEVELLEKNRFNFISDANLKSNISIAAQYIAFLYDLSNSYDVPGSVRYSIYKTIVIYAASITEALFFYALKDVLSVRPSKNKEYKKIKAIYTLDNGEELFLCSKKITDRAWNDVGFSALNQYAKSKNIIDSDLHDKCEILRKQRNKIHIGDLSAGDDFFEIEEIKEIFETLGTVIHKVRNLN